MIGCVPQNAHKRVFFDPDFNETIVPFHTPVVPADHKDFAVHELIRGTGFFYSGDCFHSDTRFAGALTVMKQLASDNRETSGLVVAEHLRTYRGEPYERATAYLYRGICQFNRGNYEAALAAFRSSLESDKETRNDKNPTAREDFYISHFLAAITYERLGEHDNAVAMLELARGNRTDIRILQKEVLEQNFVAIIATGGGPIPVQTALYAKGYRAQPSPVWRVELVVDGAVGGDAWEATDLFVQADSNQFGGADTAAIGRAVGKAVLSGVIAGLTGVRVNLEEHRDLRYWSNLPGKFFIFAGHLEPGLHHMQLRFYDESGNHLERYEQVWYEVPVYKTAERIFWRGSGPNVHNAFGLEPKSLREALEIKRTKMNQANTK